MAYRLRYSFNVDWVGPGMGPMSGRDTPLNTPAGGAQTFGGVNAAGGQNIVGTTTFTPPGGSAISGALASGDITTLTQAMQTDVAAQLNAVLSRLQAFVAGGG